MVIIYTIIFDMPVLYLMCHIHDNELIFAYKGNWPVFVPNDNIVMWLCVQKVLVGCFFNCVCLLNKHTPHTQARTQQSHVYLLFANAFQCQYVE